MIKSYKLKTISYKLNRGMTYVEFIVVLSIFAAVSSVVLFNYAGFQSKVDIKNLASEVALKIVEAQKAALSGLVPPLVQQVQIVPPWKPSYGVYFDLNPATENKNIVYFVDINSNGLYEAASCPGSGECLDKISIAKGNYISNLSVYYVGNTTASSLEDLTVSFKRPNGSAILSSTPAFSVGLTVNYVEITVTSPDGVNGAASAKIKVYPSGRIQID